jgi:formiminoglutamase
VVVPFDDLAWSGSRVLLGFCCDEGVKRNKGQPGAADGPGVIRSMLANLAYDGDKPVFDAGNVMCAGDNLEQAQANLARLISTILDRGMSLIVLGGGHEIAWASFQGIIRHLQAQDVKPANVGIINFDAHFDLRNPAELASSGTPFRQIAQWSHDHGENFNYHVIGLNPSANTAALFEYAKSRNVSWVEDIDVHSANIESMIQGLRKFIGKLDYLYLTVCLDVFSASIAPGVSAPASAGVSSEVVIKLVRSIKLICHELDVPIILSDIAEMNPHCDIDQRTARLAARLVWEMCREPAALASHE